MKPNSQLEKTFWLVREYPNQTASELAGKATQFENFPRESLHKRLPELRRLGKVQVSGERVCQVSRKLAKIWSAVEA